MNSFHSAQHVINLLIKKSKEKIQDNKMIKSKLAPYSSYIAESNRNDAIIHTGTQFDRSNGKCFKQQLSSQNHPLNNAKDSYSFFSIKQQKVIRKQASPIFIPEQKSPPKIQKKRYSKTIFNNSMIKKKTESTNPKTTSKLDPSKEEQQSNLFLVQLNQHNLQIPICLQRQDYHINDLRERKKFAEIQNNTYKKRQQNDSQMSTERQNKLASNLQNHLSKPNSSYTFDVEGKMLLFSFDTNKKAISKVFPPTIRYGVVAQKDQKQPNQKKSNSKSFKNRAYSNLQFKKKEKTSNSIDKQKGQVFKSSVVKTINISRTSLGYSQIDENQFMRRNDLFNNNHLRQTTTIPFIKMQAGISLKQAATNQYIANKDSETYQQSKAGRQHTSKSVSQARSRSYDQRAKRQFRKFSSKRQSQQSINQRYINYGQKKISSGTCQNFKKVTSIGDSRYSSFYIQRSRTQQVGRIKRENQPLFQSLVDQNEQI